MYSFLISTSENTSPVYQKAKVNKSYCVLIGYQSF